ncbi:MAG: hypothetical protein FKY71_16475 [Spiribacter salinus]|uniref:Uncharacterized protein n=1 Tax=Spiribacter salinus TaxID=1335746 RepID=A0A540VIV0_9GAMM|nr:MAG: hypothetical protein FKY71_16475 [Spiribacter salinus]
MDATLRDSVVMRGASFGAQFRGGAYIVDTVFLDNNIPLNVLGGAGKGGGNFANYSLLDGNLVTSAAHRGKDCPKIGAYNWGIRNAGLMTSFMDNLVVHANDPNNPDDTRSSKSAISNIGDPDHEYYNDTVIWRWGWGGEKEADQDTFNVEGRDPDAMNATTIENYIEGSIEDFAQYIRGRDSAEYAGIAKDVLAYFRTGFSIPLVQRNGATTLRFIPDPRGEGVRWDNRRNWDSGDLPRTGDSVDLGGNKVVCPALTSNINDLTFGKFGSLTINSGKLTVSGVLDGGEHAKIRIGNAGQFWLGGEVLTSPISINVTGGRFCNTGTFNGPSETVASGGEMILAAESATFELRGGLEIQGTAGKVGFDGTSGIAALTVFDGSRIAFVADADGVAPISKFRSGAFEANESLSTSVTLAGDLVVDLAAYEGGPQVLSLIVADTLTGSFASMDVVNVPDGLTASVVQTETVVELSVS